WERRLSSGDGYRHGGHLVTRPGRRGLFRVSLAGYQVDPYSSFLMYLDRYTQVMRLARQRPLDVLVFPYDWRLDGTLSAQLLGEAIRRRWWSQGMPSEVAQADRVLIFAHSLGGLLARYYVEQLGGHRLVRHLVTAGTPHRGGPIAYGILTGLQ